MTTFREISQRGTGAPAPPKGKVRILRIPGIFAILYSVLIPVAFITTGDSFYLALSATSALWAIWSVLVEIWEKLR